VKALGLIILAMLSGCATFYDNQDPCQSEPYPSYCGAGDLPQSEILERIYEESQS